MKTNKGFTLIELLAVIVILAIIALIAVPIILGVIDKAKVGSAEASVLGYVDSVEKQVILEITKGNSIENTDYTIDENSIFTKYKGSKVTGTFTLSKNQIISGNFCVNGYSIDYDGKKAKYNKGTNYCNEEITHQENEMGEITDNLLDDNPTYEEKTILDIVKEKTYQVKVSTGNDNENNVLYIDPANLENTSCDSSNDNCMKFYYIGESDGKKNFIADRNIVDYVTFDNAAIELQNATLDWEIKPRMITADEIAEITGAATALSWNSTKNYSDRSSINKETHIYRFNLDGGVSNDYYGTNGWTVQTAKTQGASKYAWLFDYTSNCTVNGCQTAYANTSGYWTSTTTKGHQGYSWCVSRMGTLTTGLNTQTNYNGIRPVLSI